MQLEWSEFSPDFKVSLKDLIVFLFFSNIISSSTSWAYNIAEGSTTNNTSYQVRCTENYLFQERNIDGRVDDSKIISV